jgi:predicted nucleic acid-binding protein
MKLPEKIIDANIILRFFLADNEEQFSRAKAFVNKLELGQEETLLNEIVFAEVIWVLNKVYNIPRQEITDKFLRFINYRGIKTILDKEIFLDAIRLYPKYSMDIQDIFIGVLSRHKDCSIVTFDKGDFKKLQCKHAEP